MRIFGLLVTLSTIAAMACGGGDAPASTSSPIPDQAPASIPSPVPYEAPAVIALEYSEICGPCGATFRAKRLLESQDGLTFQVNLEITNTGERGDLDFATIDAYVFSIDAEQDEPYRAGFAQDHRNAAVGRLLAEVGVIQHPFSHFLNSLAMPGTAPKLAVGESWDGWLVFYGALPPETAGLVLQIRGIQGSRDTSASRRSSGWVSFTADQPYIAIKGE